jgi:hypothetical protein
MSFGEILKITGMTPHQFAKTTGWSYNAVLSWLKNEPPHWIDQEIKRTYRMWKITSEPKSPLKAFRGLKTRIFHVAPKSGKPVISNRKTRNMKTSIDTTMEDFYKVFLGEKV